MAKYRRWSTASAPCRLEWRPSRWLAAALSLLGALAALGLIVSELPGWLSAPSAAMALGYGFWLSRRELQRPVRDVVIPPGPAPAAVDGQEVAGLQLRWRGALAFLQWRDAAGRLQRLHGMPDNLGPSARRELRLAMAARGPARPRRSMAP